MLGCWWHRFSYPKTLNPNYPYDMPQVTDTPGLLDRPDEERNAMEQLTLAVLRHLDSTALFVVDLTEGCGTPVEEQWSLRCVWLGV